MTEKSCHKFVSDSTVERKEINAKLKNKYGDIIDDINEIMDEYFYKIKTYCLHTLKKK